jgi:transposase
MQPIPKGIPTAGLLAHVAVAKFDDHLPLYRQSEIWDRLGVNLPRSTLSSWILKMGDLLKPMIPLLQNHIIQSGYINADETTTQVLREPGRVPTSTSYMWVYMTGNHKHNCIVYEYQPTRHGDHAKTFLNGFKGTLQTDGYSGYHATTGSEHVISAGCWAHARRKFHDVWIVLKKDGAASKALEIIGKCYDVERHMSEQNFTTDHIKTYRQEMSKPILEALHTWLISIKPKVPPKSSLSKAITYTLNQWEPLTRYLEDGQLSIDNNAAERQIRPFTIGRKNWLFMGSVAGAKAASAIYSLIETAKANGLNPEAYLTTLLKNIPTTTPDMHHTLLPWNMVLPVAMELPA